MEEAVKSQLRVFYTSSDQQEATEFFNKLITSESECPILLNILIEIFLQDEDENLKRMSLIIIREINCDIILESIFLLFQKSDFKYYSTIEILTEKLAIQKNEELFPIINNLLSTSSDIFTHIAILQLLNSIKRIAYKKDTQIANFENIQKEYYEYFNQAIRTIIQNQEPTVTDFYFMFYFASFFFDLMHQINENEFFFTFSIYFLNHQEQEEVNKNLLDIIVDYFPSFYQSNEEIENEMIVLLIEYCQAMDYIPNEMIKIWPYLVKNKVNLDYNVIVPNFIFTQFKFEPDSMIYDQEKFIDEFDPYPDSKSEISMEVFVDLMNKISEDNPLFDSAYQFVDSYYQEFFDKDSSEICRILNFLSIFGRPNNQFTQDFFENRIIPLINTVATMENPDFFLIIGICQVIKNICYFIDSEKDQLFVSMSSTFMNFLKWSVLSEFNFNENMASLLFYFVVNSITSFLNAFSVDLFDFNEEEVTNIFMKISQLYKEINNDWLTVSFNTLVEKMMPSDTNIESFVCMVWDCIIQHKEKDLLENFFILITNFFDVCYEYEEKQTIFNVFFQLVTNEESKDFLIEKCFIDILELFVLFTKELLDDAEKVPFFIESIGKFIFDMICSISSDLFPDFFNKDCFKAKKDFQSLINEYKYFCYHIINFINDPENCLEMFIKPFMIPIVAKIEEINENNNFDDFHFTALCAPLIKFKGNDDVFQCMFEFYNDFIQMKSFDEITKNYFLDSLIISKPSILFDLFDKDQFLKILNENFPQLPDDMLLFVIKEVLLYLSNEKQDPELMNIFAQLFGEQLNRLNYDKDKTVNEMCFSTSSLYTFSMYNEDFNNVILIIFDILEKFEIQLSSE